MIGGVCSVLFLAGNLPGGDQCGHMKAQTDEGKAVMLVVEVAGVGLTVAIDVRSAGVGGVRPEVIGLGEVVMRAACAAVAVVGGDANWLFAEIFVGRTKYSLAVNLGYVDV